MKYIEPFIAELGDVTIIRERDTAVVKYKEKNVYVTNLKIGKDIENMSDQEILDCHNEIIRSKIALAVSGPVKAHLFGKDRALSKGLILNDRCFPRLHIMQS